MTSKINFFLFPICVGFLLLCASVSAQVQHIIRGKVVDAATNLPISGVTVQAKGSSTGTTTDDKGEYKLNVSGNSSTVLVFSYVGYAGKELKIGKSETGNISLETGTNALNEVVVVAYASEQKKDITGAVSVVNVDEMAKQPSGLVTDQLQGQASGVTVIASGQPGAD